MFKPITNAAIKQSISANAAFPCFAAAAHLEIVQRDDSLLRHLVPSPLNPFPIHSYPSDYRILVFVPYRLRAPSTFVHYRNPSVTRHSTLTRVDDPWEGSYRA